MESQPFLEKIRAELVQRGLPRYYIERLLTELHDHCCELHEERSLSMSDPRKSATEPICLEHRLGSPAQFASFAAAQYRARTFWGRHPWVTFLIAPLPLFTAFFITLCVAMRLTMVPFLDYFESPLSDHMREHPYLQAILFSLVSWQFQVLPALMAAGLLCRVAQRHSLLWRWPMIGCTLLAGVAACITVIHRIETNPGNGTYAIGFNLGDSPAWWFLTFLPKLAVGVAIGLLLVVRSIQQGDGSTRTAQ